MAPKHRQDSAAASKAAGAFGGLTQISQDTVGFQDLNPAGVDGVAVASNLFAKNLPQETALLRQVERLRGRGPESRFEKVPATVPHALALFG
jgi:hypothetical protein